MARRRKKASNKTSLWILLAIIAVLTIMAGMFYASISSDKESTEVKAVDGSKKEIVSLLDESIEAQRILDSILLQKGNWQLIEKGHGVKNVDVEGTTAAVKVNTRTLAIGVPVSTTLENAGNWVQGKATKAGLAVISGEPSTYKGWESYKLQLGVAAKAGGINKKFTVDTIYFFYNTNLSSEGNDVISPPATTKEEAQYTGKLAIIVDDCGYDIKSVRRLTDLGLPLSFAILPYKDFSNDALEVIKSTGNVPMLHLPMEPSNRSAMSEGSRTILTDMKEKEIRKMTKKAIESLPGIVGVNNHQGSKATSDKRVMETVLREVKKQGLFFVDSKTIATSVARDMAREMGVKTARNDVFLDNSKDVEEIRKQVYKAIEMAEKNGSAIAICHARPATVKMWEKYADEFRKTGVKFVHVTEVLY
ncbi:MAG: divergent polysaccharide deacetylase family protein [Acidaminococcaceae bacterium]|nr:divergent polysaccharide deacetylase family protein [Acidaminococcaceae bacterium]